MVIKVLQHVHINEVGKSDFVFYNHFENFFENFSPSNLLNGGYGWGLLKSQLQVHSVF